MITDTDGIDQLKQLNSVMGVRITYGIASALSFAMSRDLRRAALFLWITPLLATRSSTLTASSVAAFAASTFPVLIACSAFFTELRASVRNGLLRAACRAETRIRFFEDLELAKFRRPPPVENRIELVHLKRAQNTTRSADLAQDVGV
jgi:hypothetical protein